MPTYTQIDAIQIAWIGFGFFLSSYFSLSFCFLPASDSDHLNHYAPWESVCGCIFTEENETRCSSQYTHAASNKKLNKLFDDHILQKYGAGSKYDTNLLCSLPTILYRFLVSSQFSVSNAMQNPFAHGDASLCVRVQKTTLIWRFLCHEWWFYL